MRKKKYTQGEEIANAITHGLGILIGVAAAFLFMQRVDFNNDLPLTITLWVYLFGMLSSYISSTAYHSCVNERIKKILRKFDHGAIYLHIAGTYAPFSLIIYRYSQTWGWSLFSFVWASAIIGFILSFIKLKEHSHLETACYVIMGGTIFVAFKPLIESLALLNATNALYWLISGGISFFIGALFYSWRKVKYMHSVFHLFVLGGSICHIIAIYCIL